MASLGLWQCSCVQTEIGAAGLEGPSTQQVPALWLSLFIHFFQHLTQISNPKIHLTRGQTGKRKCGKKEYNYCRKQQQQQCNNMRNTASKHATYMPCAVVVLSFQQNDQHRERRRFLSGKIWGDKLFCLLQLGLKKLHKKHNISKINMKWDIML